MAVRSHECLTKSHCFLSRRRYSCCPHGTLLYPSITKPFIYYLFAAMRVYGVAVRSHECLAKSHCLISQRQYRCCPHGALLYPSITPPLLVYIICLQLCECMEWLSDLTAVSPSLTISYLKDCIDAVLMEHYYTPVLQNLRKRKILGHLHQVGITVIFQFFQTTSIFFCNNSKFQTNMFYHRVMPSKDGNANSEEPDQTAPVGSSLISFYTVGSDLSVYDL